MRLGCIMLLDMFGFCRLLIWLSFAIAPVASAQPYPSTNLIELLQNWNPSRAVPQSVWKLNPEWVGTVTTAYQGGSREVFRESGTNHIRFSHAAVWGHARSATNLFIIRGRITADGKLGSYLGSEGPLFTTSLPSSQMIAGAKTDRDLIQLLGPSSGLSDGWSLGWTLFTTQAVDRLRYVNVFAMFIPPSRHIDALRIEEGFFRPADPNSAEEKMQFKTGEETRAEYEARRSKERSQYPLPLRSLVEARETPDDYDATAYYKALNEARVAPRPELFQQFAEWVHEGTCEIQGMLETLLFDTHRKLKPWDAKERRQALAALTDSLPRAKTSLGLNTLLVFLLQAQGGGRLEFSVPGTEATIDLKAHRFPDGTGASYSYGSQGVSPENLEQVARECRRVLQERYPELVID